MKKSSAIMQITKNHQIIAVGDLFLKTKSADIFRLDPDIETIFNNAPCVLANLETVLIDGGQGQEKAVKLRVDPINAKHLREAGIILVNLANNHALDYGIEGLNSTIRSLNATGIGHCGILDQGEQSPYIQQIDGMNFGFLGYSVGVLENCNIGLAALIENRIIKDITTLKSSGVDRIIVNLHWGEEYVAFPSPGQQKIARGLIDSGADVIFGHHPHVIQGIESYKHGVIFYSLGNFNFMSSNENCARLPNSRWGMMAKIKFFPTIEYECIPIMIDDEYLPRLTTKEQAKEFSNYIDKISASLYPQIKTLFWFREASLPHFCNHVPSFIRRIKIYGASHLIQMIRWIISPANFGYYLGLFLFLLNRLFRHRNFSSNEPRSKS